MQLEGGQIPVVVPAEGRDPQPPAVMLLKASNRAPPNNGRGVWGPAFARETEEATSPPRGRGKFRLGLVAAEEHQQAADQRQQGEHQKTRRGRAGGLLDPA